MKTIVLTFGLISGATIAVLATIQMVLILNGTIRMENGQLIGYTSMVLAFLAVFFGIRTYRENHGDGSITFGRAFKVGILITLITCACYVVGWQIVYRNFMPDFADRYAEQVVVQMRESGATETAIAAEQKKMAQFKEWYANPFFNIGITFLEIFPVGLIVTLVSAAILRRKAAPPAVATAIA